MNDSGLTIGTGRPPIGVEAPPARTIHATYEPSEMPPGFGLRRRSEAQSPLWIGPQFSRPVARLEPGRSQSGETLRSSPHSKTLARTTQVHGSKLRRQGLEATRELKRQPPNPARRRHRLEPGRTPALRHGFTLIELLAVVGTIGLLAALLLSAVVKSKASAARIQCIGNLRQLGLAGQMYWDDNGGNAFQWRGTSTNGGHVYWFGWLESGSEGARRFDPAQGALYPYLGGRRVAVCPSLNYLHPRFKLKATGVSYGYGYNLLLSRSVGQPPLNLSAVTRLSELAFLADAAQVNTFQAPASPQNPMIEEFYYVSTNESTAHFRHAKTANVAFCDGHVAGEKPAPGSLDPRLPNQFIGRIGSDHLVFRD